MAIRNPTIIFSGMDAPPGARECEAWFERKVGEFTMQAKLLCFHDETTDTHFVGGVIWDEWEIEIVRFFISNGHSNPEIDAFIQSHVLPGK